MTLHQHTVIDGMTVLTTTHDDGSVYIRTSAMDSAIESVFLTPSQWEWVTSSIQLPPVSEPELEQMVQRMINRLRTADRWRELAIAYRDTTIDPELNELDAQVQALLDEETK